MFDVSAVIQEKTWKLCVFDFWHVYVYIMISLMLLVSYRFYLKGVEK